MLSLCLIIIVFINNIQIHFASSIENDNSLPNYGFELPNQIGLEKLLRNKFAQKKKSEERLRKLNEHISKDSEYFEDILHFAVNSSKNTKSKEKNIQNDFRRVIGMVGVKYTYKRDLHWRTWREVTYPNKKKEVICYRCQNSIEITKSNCTNCKHGGYWVIEEKRPSCSYEIFSFRNKDELCAAYFWQFNDFKLNSCPTIISYEQLARCNIPIVTNFVITRDYSKVSERAMPAICQGRENCVISTVYNVNSDSIVFRIINTTNDIIYSRIMKHNSKNYACFENCGKFNFDTKTATRNEDHLVLNLLNQTKKKRHDHNPQPKKYRGNKKAKKVIANSKDAFEHDESKSVISRKSDLLVKNDKYIIETPLHGEWATINKHSDKQHPSMCKQIMYEFNDENAGNKRTF